MIKQTESPADVYTVRDGHFWATVAIHDETGLVAIVSDHGNWSYAWPPGNIGDNTVHEFVARTGAEYAMRKMFPLRSYEAPDETLTRNAIKQEVLGARRRREISYDEAREMFTTAEGWDGNFDDLPLSDWLCDYWEFVRYALTSDAVAFCKVVWPVVKEVARLGAIKKAQKEGVADGK